MAKAPRKRGGADRGRGDRPRRAGSGKPAAAKPVRPASRAAAPKPPKVPPKVPRKAPPKAPAKPVAKGPAKAAARGPARGHGRASEEEVSRPRGGRGARATGGGGMGLGTKIALLTGAVTLVAIGIAVFLSGASGSDDRETQLNAFGFQAASVLAGPDARWYRGSGGSSGGIGEYERVFKDLLGEKGSSFWDERIKELSSPIPREDEGSFAGEKLKEEKKKFEKAMDRLRKGSGGGATSIRNQLGLVWNSMDRTERGRFQVIASWLREPPSAAQGAWLTGNVSEGEIQYDWSQYQAEGQGFGWIDGTVKGYPVRVFTATVRGLRPAKPIMGYVAVYEKPTSGGGSALGLLMLILGPLLVGFTAWAVAGGHAKGITGLAREIDRLGSSGDPERQLRTTGAEAGLIARSVERMVSNLEFREKHDGDDLDEVVSREQKIAEEIHGTLISKNPPRLQDYEVETLFKPGFEIGGDHFEYFRIDETHLGIILLDTNVRGIPAALVVSAAKSYMRAEAPGQLSPAAVLRKVNRHLAGELPAGRHVTALYVVLNTADGSATLASAGHLPLLVYRHQAGKMAKVNPEGIAMGLDAGRVFDSSLQEGDIPIGVGDRIVLYTDGALRIQDGAGEEFGEQRFYGAVANEAPKNSQAFVNFVGAAIDRFHLEVPQDDDITISTVKRLR